jgi:hypothetical protein
VKQVTPSGTSLQGSMVGSVGTTIFTLGSLPSALADFVPTIAKAAIATIANVLQNLINPPPRNFHPPGRVARSPPSDNQNHKNKSFGLNWFQLQLLPS